MGILQRYILGELIRVFATALVACTTVFVLGGIVHEATQRGLNPVQILYMIPFVVPATLPYIIPATLLLAVSFVYGRLAADNEVMASKAAGINAFHLIVPALALGVAMSLVTVFLLDRVIPVANVGMKTALVRNVEELVYATLKKDRSLKGTGLPYEIYVQRVEGKRLINTTFKRRAKGGDYDLIVFAQEAALQFDHAKKTVAVQMYKAEVTNRDGLRVETRSDKVFELPMPQDVKGASIRDLTMAQLRDERNKLIRDQRAECGRWVVESLPLFAGGRLDEVQWSKLAPLAAHVKDTRRDLWRINCEPAMRWALAFGCLGFVLLGCPIAILFRRGDYLSAFISCFLPIVLVYYPLMMFGFNLCKEGLAAPTVMWVGNILLAILGLIAMRPVLRY
jgi:lipopolysaccharide export system permease protein